MGKTLLLLRPALPPPTVAALADLRAAGIQPTDSEILWLADLGRKRQHPDSATYREIFDWPVRIPNGIRWGKAESGKRKAGKSSFSPLSALRFPSLSAFRFPLSDLLLYRSSAGASVWWNERGREWLADSPPKWRDPEEWSLLVHVWLAAHARDEAALQALTRSNAQATVIAWGWRLAAPLAALAHALAELGGCLGCEGFVEVPDPFAVPDAPAESPSPAVALNYGPTIARLCAHYQLPPRYWWWNCSEDELWAKVKDMRESGGPTSGRAQCDFLAAVRWIKAGRPDPDAPSVPSLP